MAGKSGRATFNLIVELLKNGKSFSFFQVMRLLNIYRDKHWSDAEINIRPDLSFAFPVSSTHKIEETETGFAVFANFLSLYGSSSPLPAFFTEELFEEERLDRSNARDFVDLINRRFYELFFEVQAKYKSLYQTQERKNDKHVERLYSLIGLGSKPWRKSVDRPYSQLRYIGLLSQFPRSALGLEIVLKDALKVPISILSCQFRVAIIPGEQLCRFGEANSSLGADVYLGGQTVDRNKCRIRMGPLTELEFRRFLPGTDDYRRMISITQFYAKSPSEFDIESNLKAGEAETVCLGNQRWGAIGLDTWIFSGEEMGMGTAVYSI